MVSVVSTVVVAAALMAAASAAAPATAIERTIAAHTTSDAAQHAAFVRRLFDAHAREYAALGNISKIYADGDDLVWRNNPKAWHQQTARTIDHRFTSFDELAAFATAAIAMGEYVIK